MLGGRPGARWRTGWLPRPATVVSVVALLAAWELFSLGFPDYQFPGLVAFAENIAVVVTGADRFDPAVHVGATLARILAGFGISMALATTWGAVMGVYPQGGEYLAGPLFVFLTVPSVVWAFLGVLWFGLAEFLVPVFVIVLVVFPYLTVTVWEGAEALDPALVEMGRAFGAGEAAMWRHVYLPHLRPYLLGAARLGFAVSWKLSLVAEVFGAATGVGVVVKYHFENFDTGMVMAWAVPVMALTYGVEVVLRRAERRAARWRTRTDVEPMEMVE